MLSQTPNWHTSEDIALLNIYKIEDTKVLFCVSQTDVSETVLLNLKKSVHLYKGCKDLNTGMRLLANWH